MRVCWLSVGNSGDTILIAGACGAEASGVANTEDRRQRSEVDGSGRGSRAENLLHGDVGACAIIS
jgi:hypothetical protein